MRFITDGRMKMRCVMRAQAFKSFEESETIRSFASTVSDTGRRRKYYALTEHGRAELAVQRQQWQAVDAALRNIWSSFAMARAERAPSFA